MCDKLRPFKKGTDLFFLSLHSLFFPLAIPYLKIPPLVTDFFLEPANLNTVQLDFIVLYAFIP